MQSTGDALHADAVRLSNDGRYADAQEVLLRIDLTDAAPNLRSRVLGTLGYVAARLGEPERADILCRDALECEGIDPATYALAAGGFGIDRIVDQPLSPETAAVRRAAVAEAARRLVRQPGGE